MSIGIEGGYSLPAVGFSHLKSGTALTLFVTRHFHIADLTLSAETSFFSGENPSNSINFFGLRCGFQKNNWLISPVIEFGADYGKHEIKDAKESGYALDYNFGLLVNFQINRMRIYPKLYYQGLTDLKVHAGFIGIKLGIGYEI